MDADALSVAKKEKSAVGLGGMTSKLTFARLATQMGIKAVIFSGRAQNAIIEAVNGQTGTICQPQKSNISARNKWLASGSLVRGQLQVDQGASKALQNRHSLLAVGMVKILKSFEAGEVIEILDMDMQSIAVAKTKIDSQTLTSLNHLQNVEIAHADDIVLI
jgi:glutamate 5-kinase